MVLKEYEPSIENVIKQLCENSRFPQTTKYKQHGRISIYEHSIAVAYTSCWIARKLHFNVDYVLLIRGALLHDYFLYDWHDRNNGYRLHAFSHPRKALQNACEDFELTPKEKNIILRHMFPLTPIPPYYLESWIVCVADKFCALKETFRMNDIQLKKCLGVYQYDFK
ncbi:HD domain-containing protein [Anaerocolumna sp.]|uniref:HD domain-containing protein n=1 Tax=Anaerocolumna sp. TaxID=2041569 RepID=UPI0028A6A211|nr:HD domain-containing protein [Anaerocolumna sp.]